MAKIEISTTDYAKASKQLAGLTGDDLYGNATFKNREISSVKYHPRYLDWLIQFYGKKGIFFLADLQKAKKNPMVNSDETKAWASVGTKEKLKKRLMDARSVLTPHAQSLFKKKTIDYDRRAMISDNGQYVLQWKVRNHPSKPVSYENQQTSRGTVVVDMNHPAAALDNPMTKKYPPVPKILRSVPLHLNDMTDKQWDASVLWYSKLPLTELRKRQGIVDDQIKELYKAVNRRDVSLKQDPHALMSWNNLHTMEDVLTQAVMKKEFKDNPAKKFDYLVIGRQGIQKYMALTKKEAEHAKLEGLQVIGPYGSKSFLKGMKKNPRNVSAAQLTEMINLYHLARTALSGKDDSKYQRLIWASKEFHKKHADISQTKAYLDLSDYVNYGDR